MYNAACVRVRERGGKLSQNRDDVADGQRRTRCEALGQRLAGDVAHDEIHDAVTFGGGVDRHDIVMRQRTGSSRFAQKAIANQCVSREVRRQCLDRNLTLQLLVGREIHHTHAPPPDLTLETVLTGDRTSECSGR